VHATLLIKVWQDSAGIMGKYGLTSRFGCIAQLAPVCRMGKQLAAQEHGCHKARRFDRALGNHSKHQLQRHRVVCLDQLEILGFGLRTMLQQQIRDALQAAVNSNIIR